MEPDLDAKVCRWKLFDLTTPSGWVASFIEMFVVCVCVFVASGDWGTSEQLELGTQWWPWRNLAEDIVENHHRNRQVFSSPSYSTSCLSYPVFFFEWCYHHVPWCCLMIGPSCSVHFSTWYIFPRCFHGLFRVFSIISHDLRLRLFPILFAQDFPTTNHRGRAKPAKRNACCWRGSLVSCCRQGAIWNNEGLQGEAR